MIDEFDDVLGGTNPPRGPGTPVKRGRGRPRKEEIAARDETLKDFNSIANGVPIVWLTNVFRMSRADVVERLKRAPVYRWHQNGAPYYDMKVAAAHLVDPIIGDDFIKRLKPEHLPERYREAYWNAKTKELKYRVLAGELWHTESVMEVLSDTFQLIANKAKLFADDLEEETELTEKQRKLIMSMSDNLMKEVREELIERVNKKHTESYVAEIDSE